MSSKSWQRRVVEFTKERWHLLCVHQPCPVPVKGADQRHLEEVIGELNKWRNDVLERCPADVRQQLESNHPPIPDYALKSGDPPPSLGELKKKNELSRTVDAFRVWFDTALQPWFEEKQQHCKRVQQLRSETMQSALAVADYGEDERPAKKSRLDTGSAAAATVGSASDAAEIAKLQITAILDAFHGAHGLSRSGLLCDLLPGLLMQETEVEQMESPHDMHELLELLVHESPIDNLESGDFRSAGGMSRTRMLDLARTAAAQLLLRQAPRAAASAPTAAGDGDGYRSLRK